MARVIVNGKAVNVPNSASDQDIIRASGRNFNPKTLQAGTYLNLD